MDAGRLKQIGKSSGEKNMATATAAIPGVIEAGAVYTLEELKRRSGCGSWALRQMRRAGLPVKYLGGRGFIRGEDFISHVASAGDAEHHNAK